MGSCTSFLLSGWKRNQNHGISCKEGISQLIKNVHSTKIILVQSQAICSSYFNSQIGSVKKGLCLLPVLWQPTKHICNWSLPLCLKTFSFYIVSSLREWNSQIVIKFKSVSIMFNVHQLQTLSVILIDFKVYSWYILNMI